MMQTTTAPPEERRERERAEVATVLLLVQSVFGLLTLLGTIVAAAFFPVLSPAGLLVVAGFLVPLCCAIGVARRWCWAPRATLIFQGFLLFSLWVNLLLDLLPPLQMELTLTGLITGALLPAAVIVLVRVPATQATTQRRAPSTGSRVLTQRPALNPQHSALPGTRARSFRDGFVSTQHSALTPEA